MSFQIQKRVTQLLFARSPAVSAIYLCGPPIFVEFITYGNKLLYFHAVEVYWNIRTLVLVTILYCFSILCFGLTRFFTYKKTPWP
jgi:hypothetical protein